jgi:hypothetical protein
MHPSPIYSSSHKNIPCGITNKPLNSSIGGPRGPLINSTQRPPYPTVNSEEGGEWFHRLSASACQLALNPGLADKTSPTDCYGVAPLLMELPCNPVLPRRRVVLLLTDGVRTVDLAMTGSDDSATLLVGWMRKENKKADRTDPV